MAQIVVQNLTKIYGDEPRRALELLRDGYSKEEILTRTGQTVAVGGISFEVKEGETFILMGLSGSGKSTVIRCINRLLEPTTGSICVDGKRVEEMDKRELRAFRGEKIGMVFQEFALFPHRTVLDNVAFGLETKGVPKGERYERSEEILTRVGLAEWKAKRPDELSGGMKQRVGLARALVVDPDILLMDEPFSALDPLIRNEMQEELLSLQQRIKKTIIFVTHDLDEGLKLGDRMAIMWDGRIDQTGIGKEILSHPANDYVAKFVQKVDVTRMLTAEEIMIQPREILNLLEDPQSAIKKMELCDTDYIFVIGRDRKLKGLIWMKDALKLAEKGEKGIQGILKQADTVHPTTSIEDIYLRIGRTRRGLAVVDDGGNFMGAVTAKSILSLLAEGRKGP
jgi:glycine betaine/proline transport system ATP-binding protein